MQAVCSVPFGPAQERFNLTCYLLAGLVGHLEDVVVDGGRRGSGLGRALLIAALETARRSGCDRLRLNCKPENAAFYEKCSFKRSSEPSLALYFDR